MSLNKPVKFARLDRTPSHSVLMQLLREAQKFPNKRFQAEWPAGGGDDKMYAITCSMVVISKDLLSRSSGPAQTNPAEWTLSHELEHSSVPIWAHATGDLELILNLIHSEVSRGADAILQKQVSLQQAPEQQTSQQLMPLQHTPALSQPSYVGTHSMPPDGNIGQITLAGDIATVDLTNIFQSIGICKMTGRLNLYHHTTQGEIYFTDGNIVHALLHSAMDTALRLTPEQVVLELLTWQAGTFRFNPGWTTSEKSINRRLDSFLLEGAALSDYQQALAGMGLDETKSRVKKDSGYLSDALNEILSKGVAVDVELQKQIYNAADAITPVSELVQDLPRTVWIPAIFNLINTKLFQIVNEDEAEEQKLEPVEIDETIARNAARSLCRPDTGIMSAPFLYYFLGLEFSRHKRTQTPLSLVMVTLPEHGTGKEMQILQNCFDQMTDDFERLAHYDMYQGRRLVMILPYRNLSSSYLFVVRMINRLERFDRIKIDDFRFAIASAPEDSQTLETLLAALLHAQKQGETLQRKISSYAGIELERWDEFRKQAEAAQKAGKVDEASDLWLRCLTEAQEFDADDARLMYTVDRLSAINMNSRKFETAEGLLVLACELKREAKLQQELAASLGELGKCYFEQGKFEKAQEALLESIEIFERRFGADHELVGDGVHNLATVYHLQDKTDDAGKAYQKAIRIKQNYLGRNHPETIKMAQNYTKLLRSQSVEHRNSEVVISGQWRTLNFDPAGEIGVQIADFTK